MLNRLKEKIRHDRIAPQCNDRGAMFHTHKKSITPRFSIIVPLYKAERYVEDCLGSLLRQTFTDFEALVVDDSSPDESLLRARKVAQSDERFRFFQLPENRGQSAARNVALDAACGDIIILLDSDDYLKGDALEKIDRRFRAQNLDDLYFNAESFYEDQQSYDTLVEDFSEREPFEGITTGCELFAWFVERDQFMPHGALRAVRRDLIENAHIRFAEGIIHEDLLFTLNTLVLSRRSSFLHDVVYMRRIHLGSTMTAPRRTMANIAGHLRSVAWLRQWCTDHADEVKPTFLDAAASRLDYYLELCAYDWHHDVTPAERDEFLESLTPAQRFVFQQDVAGRASHQIRDEKRLREIFNSHSWRIGQLIVKVPHAMKGVLGKAAKSKRGA